MVARALIKRVETMSFDAFLRVLTLQEGEGGFIHYYKCDYEDMRSTSASKDVYVSSCLPGMAVHACYWIFVEKIFQGGAGRLEAARGDGIG